MAEWSAEQRANANIIIQTGLNMGMGWRDIQVGLMTAMQESTLRNLDYGDRDSAGLFQQRPSQGWGSFEQVTDPEYAATKFFNTLKGVKDRGGMALTAAAQAVQRSAFPDAYARWTQDALKLVNDAQGSGVKITPQTTPVVGQLDFLTEPDQLTAQQPLTPGTANAALAATTAGGSMSAPGLESAVAGPTDQTGTTIPQLDMPTYANTQEYVMAGGGAYGQRGVDQTRKGLTEYARQFVGTPYVWGGTNLDSGVDCSGFVQAVYKHFGVDLPRVSFQQVNKGTRVGLDKLRPGDLVGWDNSPRNPGADHVAIYLGGGQIIEAPRPGVGVRVRKLGSGEGAWGSRLDY